MNHVLSILKGNNLECPPVLGIDRRKNRSWECFQIFGCLRGREGRLTAETGRGSEQCAVVTARGTLTGLERDNALFCLILS